MSYTIIEEHLDALGEPHRDDGPAVIYRDNVTGEIVCEYYVHGHDMASLDDYVTNVHPGIAVDDIRIVVDYMRSTFGDPLTPRPA